MKIKCYLSIIKLLIVIAGLNWQSNALAQNKTIDSLQALLKTTKEDSSKVNILNILSARLIDIANYEEAITAANEAIVLSSKLTFAKGISDGYNVLGNSYHYQGSYSKALNYYFKALEICEKEGDKKKIPYLLGNIGLIYSDQGSQVKALEYFEKALKIAQETGNKNSIALNLGNIGNLYNYKGDYDKALEYYFKCIEMNDEQKNYREKAINLNNIGVVYCLQGNYTKSLTTFLEGLKTRKEIGDKRGIELTLGNIGELYMEQKKYKEAQKYFEMALVIAKQINDREGITSLNQAMSTMYEKQNLWQLSLKFHKQYLASKDSLLNSVKSKQIAEMQTKYESEKKDKELIKKDAALLKQEVEAKQKSLERNTFLIGFVLMALFAGFIFRSWRITRKQKTIIEQQKLEVEEQKHLVEEKNKDISDSIDYAKRIQSSFLTSETYIKRFLPEYFILYKPRDIVSGDFYWVHQQNDYLYFCVADCTGHGIPGAFMSLIGMSVLNEIVFAKKIQDTNKILDELRRIVILAVNPEGSPEVVQDGMDLFLGRLNLKTKELHYSAANNSFYIFKKGELIKCKPDKMPVGSYGEFEKPFTAHSIQLEKGDIIYSSTDGFRDQFGGPEEIKYMSKRFEEYINAIADKPLTEQKTLLEKEFNSWKGQLDQIDDVCVVGIKIQ
jgi:tetratricopeptide (TPR) repeat protein